jgi:flagellar hook-associated protein 2
VSNIDGLISGMDTTAVISQLMQAERQPQVRLQTRKTAMEKAAAAYQDLNSKFAAVRDAARALATPTGWELAKGTSSAPDSVGVVAGTGASTGTLTFSVEALATAASRVSSGAVASTSAVIATGPIEITKGGVTSTIDVGDGTLASVVSAINNSSSGVKAAAVQVGPGSFKLQLTSSTSGVDSAFTVNPAPFMSIGTLDQLVTGQDASIRVGGASPAAYTVTSTTNTLSNVLPGVTLSLLKASPGTPVTVDIATDTTGMAERVQKLVDTANAALTAARTATATGTNGSAGGPIAGDTTVRHLEQEIMRAVTGLVRSDGTGSAGFVGIQTTRQGGLTFDKAKFTEAYTQDPASVAKVFTAGATTSTAAIRFVGSGATAVPGTYGVTVSAAATRATVTGGVVAGGTLAADETITITSGGKTATYNALSGDAIGDVATGLNGTFAANGLGLVASVEGGALVVRNAEYGEDATFEVVAAGSGGGQTGLAPGTYAGTDVAGHFTLGDGTVVAATGQGAILSAAADATPIGGLSVHVTGAPAGGTVTYDAGLARRLESVSTSAVQTGTGSLQLAVEGRKKQVTDLEADIASWDTRLALRQASLRKQFNAMEVALGRLREQGNWLAGQLGTLSS